MFQAHALIWHILECGAHLKFCIIEFSCNQAFAINSIEVGLETFCAALDAFYRLCDGTYVWSLEYTYSSFLTSNADLLSCLRFLNHK